MNIGINHLLNNILFIIFPLFIFQVFWLDNAIALKWTKWFGAASSLLSIVLCMTFPITFSPGFLFDLRQIPLIIGTLYLGRRSGALLIAGLLLYRWFLGGIGFYVSLIATIAIFILLIAIRQSYLNRSLRKKIAVSIGLSQISGLLVLLLTMLFDRSYSFEVSCHPGRRHVGDDLSGGNDDQA